MRGKVGVAATAIGMVGAFTFVGPGLADNEFANKYDSGEQTYACDDTGNTITYVGPEKLWPPNHKMQPVAFTATNGSGGPVSLEVLVDVGDVSGGDGGAAHDPDEAYPSGPAASGNGSATVPLELRSERSGRGDGRTYTLTASAQFNVVQECTWSLDVVVPHDMRGGADWK